MNKIFQQHTFYLLLVLLILSAFIGIKNPLFFSLSNVFDIMKSSVVMGLFALGVLIVLISGGIDISFTAIAAFSMYATGKILLSLDITDSLPLAFLLAGGIGMMLGMFNALFIAQFGLPTLIVTLGTASVFRGFLLAFVGTAIINNLPASLIRLSKFTIFDKTLPDGEIIGLSGSVFILLFFVLLTWLLLRYTMLGRGIYALGGDRTAAQRAGFNLPLIQYFIYGFVGFLSGIAGLIYASMMRNANPFDLVGTELVVIAAVVLGGARISGGKGTVTGTILGVILLVIINGSLILLDIPSYWQRVAIGLIILVGTALTVQRKIKKKNGS